MKDYLKLAEEAYPKNRSYFCAHDYTPMIDLFGHVLVRVDDQDYEGDTRLAYYKDNKYGYLNIGWGSCSGCDALQACDNHEQVAELMKSLENNIRWFESLNDLKEYIQSEDRKLNYCYHMKEWKDFVAQVVALEETIQL